MIPARVLVVEDEAPIAMFIEMMLLRLGHRVVALASSGEDAIRLVGETRPDVVLMDIGLKGEIDGIEAAGQIQARFAIPVVFLTAYGDTHTMQRAAAAKPAGFLVKPLDEESLQATLEAARCAKRATPWPGN